MEALHPDSKALAGFCSAMFRHAQPTGFVSLRAFRDNGKNEKAFFIEPITIGNPEFLNVVVERARQAAVATEPVVFCPPVATFRSSENAKSENLLEGVALSVECDREPAKSLEVLRSLLGEPTIVNASGGEWQNPESGEVERKLHLHWRLIQPTRDHDAHVKLREARELATALVGGDATAIPMVHPLRWPGSWHRKKEPRLAEIVSQTDCEIELTIALDILRDAVGASATQKGPSSGVGDGFAGFKKLVAENQDDIAAALRVIPNDNLEWSVWNNIGLATWAASAGSTIGLEAFADWSSKSSKNDSIGTSDRWAHYATSPPSKIGFGTLVYLARKHSPGWQTKAEQEAGKRGGPIYPQGYGFSERGLSWSDPNDDEKPPIIIASRFDVVAETRDHDGASWGVLLHWNDRDGRDHRHALPRVSLAGDGADARRILLDGGLYVAPGKKARDLLNSFLLQVQSPIRARATQRIGWHGNSFVMPDDCFASDQRDTLLLQSATAHEHSFRQNGTLESWQQNVARYASGNSRLVLAISAAFAGPLVGPCSAEGGGIHFKGASSTGKSTALHVAGSVWGGGDTNGFVRSWRATANGLEGVSLGHSDTLLCLDELSQLAGKDAGEAAYMLANGAGKSRSSRDGSARKAAKWRVLFLSSGEIGLADKVAEDGRGRKLAAGQQVRIVDISADAGAGMGMFENLHGFASADVFARHIRAAALQNYGVASREYLKAIVPAIDDIRKLAMDVVRAFCEKYVPEGADGQVERVAQRFGLIAAGGEIAWLYDIAPWERGAAVEAAAKCFGHWLFVRGGHDAAEERDGIEQVRSFLLANGMARFIPAWEDAKNSEIRAASNLPALASNISARDVAGYRQKTGDGWDFFVTTTAWKDICSGLDARRTVAMLKRRGYLETGEGTHLGKTIRVPGHGKLRLYHILSTFLEDDNEA